MQIHERDLLELATTIRTPENLELRYALAGAGSRAAAYIVDGLILLFSVQILANLFMLIFALPLGPEWAVAISGFLAFAIINGYFILFEWLFNGQTPGKRLIGIRVIKQGGYALNFLDVLLRNLMRIVDFLPAFYGVGVVSLMATSRCQRLGDVVAGTLVVQQEALSTSNLLPVIPAALEGGIVLSPGQISAVPNRLIDLAVEFFVERDRLASRYRQQIAVELSDLVSRVGRIEMQLGQSAESFLAAVIRQSGRIQTAALSPDSPASHPS
jgi:uncharacterized RDD family membrane protein YckC